MWKASYFRLKSQLLILLGKRHGGRISIGKNVRIRGFPYLVIKGELEVGDNAVIKSSLKSNPTNHYKRTVICVDKGAKLSLGSGAGVSNAVIYCSKSILIDRSAMVGSGVRIWDTDFHSTSDANNFPESVTIGAGAWIGADTIVLKGSEIPKDTTIGAASLVTKSSSPKMPGKYAGNPLRRL